MDLKGRGILILALVVIGAVLASAVTEYTEKEPPLKHHIKTGKVGTNPDGTMWVAEFIKENVLFNYTLPASSVHSRYMSYSSVSIVAVPDYSQNFEMERTEDDQYVVYYPSFKASIPVNTLESFVEGKENTDLVKVYGLFAQSVSDIRVLSKIHESTFAVNGIVTTVHRGWSTSIDGYVLTADNKHYMVMLDAKHSRVVSFTELDFEYK